MLATCFSTVPPVTTSASAMPAFERPSAISASTWRSRAVSAARPSARRLARSSWPTTSGSSAVPPAATRSSASANSATSATRSFSRYPAPAALPSSSRAVYLVSMYCDSTSTPVRGCWRRISSAARSLYGRSR
jgi:hypothetical protein